MDRRTDSRKSFLPRVKAAFLLALTALLFSCSELREPEAEPFYAETVPPPIQEFRWTNGSRLKSLDPAIASAPPETDVVRALFEGLTETDPRTLAEMPGVAEKWNSSDDGKTWTFYLRDDARWSNGDIVTAHDFVRSWRRLAEMGGKPAHSFLYRNIVGMGTKKPEDKKEPAKGPPDFLRSVGAEPGTAVASPSPGVVEVPGGKPSPQPSPIDPDKFGVEAPGDLVLQVKLVRPDPDFPKLVAHAVFRPVHESSDFEEPPAEELVTNGPFKVVKTGEDGLTLERSETYWNRDEVKLERIRFVPSDDAEQALRAYRAGEVDVVTNAEFEPLALKLLAPYDDFRRTTHGALNFYEFNIRKAPFNDRRVREALAISIDRERLTEGEMRGSTLPARGFLPFAEDPNARLQQDPEKARGLLERAGFPEGEGFPTVRLVINRNDAQQRIARSVAKMWEDNLGIETEIVVQESAELEKTRGSGEFDVIRRNVVFPTADEAANLLAVFGDLYREADLAGETRPQTVQTFATNSAAAEPSPTSAAESPGQKTGGRSGQPEIRFITTEEEALIEFYAIPLYFPTSYSLIKPYVRGFDVNGLDSPLLRMVHIDNNWQPKTPKSES